MFRTNKSLVRPRSRTNPFEFDHEDIGKDLKEWLLRGDVEMEQTQGEFDVLVAMEDHLSSYDTNVYYAAVEYEQAHQLDYKKQRRETDPAALPLRYQALLLWSNPTATKWGIAFFICELILILISVVQILVESIPRFNPVVFPKYKVLWDTMESVVACFFLLELVVHFFLLPRRPDDFSLHESRSTFFTSFLTWVDILTILPVVLNPLEDRYPALGALEFLKTLRVLRLTKVLRQIPSVDPLALALERSFRPLVPPFAVIFGLMYTISAALYFAERGTYDSNQGIFLHENCDCLQGTSRVLDPTYPCPLVESKFLSIFHTLWFTLVTMTTVGYGDMTPLCPTGRMIAMFAMVLGNFIVLSIPAAIVGTFFTSIVQEAKQKEQQEKEQTEPSAGEHKGPRNCDGSLRRSVKHEAASKVKSLGPMQTMGSRLAAQLADLEVHFHLLKPPAIVLHTISMFVKDEFRKFLMKWETADGRRAIREAASSYFTPVSLELMSAPTESSLPSKVLLNQPLSFRIGSKMSIGSARGENVGDQYHCGELLRFVDAPRLPPRLPSSLFHVTLDPLTHVATIAAIFPAKVSVNGEVVGYDAAWRLFPHDVIAVDAGPAAPPLAFQYEVVDATTGMAAGDTQKLHELICPSAPRKKSVGESGQAASLVAQTFSTSIPQLHVRLAPDEEPTQRSGTSIRSVLPLTFSHYCPTASQPSTADIEFSDL